MEMKDFLEIYTFTRWKIKYHWLESLKKGEKNDFHKPEDQLPTSKNKLFLSKLFSPYSKNLKKLVSTGRNMGRL